jgi:hypothetical protein
MDMNGQPTLFEDEPADGIFAHLTWQGDGGWTVSVTSYLDALGWRCSQHLNRHTREEYRHLTLLEAFDVLDGEIVRRRGF